MQIQAEVVGQCLAIENVIEQTFVAFAHQHHVMRHIGILPVGTEVPDKQAHGVFCALQLAVGPPPTISGRQQPPVGCSRVGVRDDDVRVDTLTAIEHHAGRAAVFDKDLADRGVHTQRAALRFDQRDEPIHQATRPAHRKMDAVAALELGNQRVYRRRRKRVAANQQRMETEHDPEFRMLDVARDKPVHRAVKLRVKKIWQHREHFSEAVERLVEQPVETDVIKLRAGLEKALVAGHIVRAEARNLGFHGFVVARVVEMGAVVESDAVER